jgi:hypothetical protein
MEGNQIMAWCDYKPVITVTDLLDSGACPEGVLEAIDKHRIISAPTADHASNSYVASAASVNGYGSGYGSSSGYGDGYGDGCYGYGYGYGCYGDGDGDGYGYGDGSGYGCYGYGYGYGYGSGCYGDGSGEQT